MVSGPAILLDRQGPETIRARIRTAVEDDHHEIADWHLWAIGPNIYGAILSAVAQDPQPPDHSKDQMPTDLGLAHVTVEVHRADAAAGRPQ
ncbi:MAG: hypothetical protein IIA65_01790 [Planctomycetes bacterium]|nr:hypothetical protein [Planctomycetota bacterium]